MKPHELTPGNLPGVAVEARDDESSITLIRRFTRLVQRSGVLLDLKQRRFHRTRRQRERKKRAASALRRRRDAERLPKHVR